MTLQKTLLNYLLKVLRGADNSVTEITAATPVSGGSINEAYQIQTNSSTYFVKVNSAQRFPGMFEAEALSLEALRNAGTFYIPQVIEVGSEGEQAFILIEHIASGKSNHTTWIEFGQALAGLHHVTSDHFGLDNENYIGSLRQANNKVDTWPEFFASQRIESQLTLAYNHFTVSDRQRFANLLNRLPELVPREPPALLHGDLWSGNYLIDTNSSPVLIDPAVYYGHREMDIAMMHLFGGFPSEVFHHYNEQFPLEQGWQERLDLHNLYPLLVHVNLFGGSYVAQVRSILKRFT